MIFGGKVRIRVRFLFDWTYRQYIGKMTERITRMNKYGSKWKSFAEVR